MKLGGARLQARASAALAAWRLKLDRIDAMPPREKGAWAMLAVAAIAAAEFGWALPIREQRERVVAAEVAEHEAAQQAEQTRREQLAAEQTALELRLANAESQLARHGAAPARSESLGRWMQRALAGQPVRVLALRDLGVSQIDAATLAQALSSAPSAPSAPSAHAAHAALAAQPEQAAPASAASADATATATATATANATAAGVAVAAAAAPNAESHMTPQPSADATTAQPPLFRHRWELTITGSVEQLAAAVHTLAERMAPLRVERVRLSSRDGSTVEAALGFVIVTAERTWMTL
jgi:hypothetical protein